MSETKQILQASTADCSSWNIQSTRLGRESSAARLAVLKEGLIIQSITIRV